MILITGATGNIGHPLVNLLIRKGANRDAAAGEVLALAQGQEVQPVVTQLAGNAKGDFALQSSLTNKQSWEHQMKLTIFAATGGIGRQILEQAVVAGHDVTAVVRNPKKLAREVRSVTADLAAADPAVLESAIAGADAVLSGLGARSNAEAGVAWQGTRTIVQAMQATDVRRIVVVSAAPIGTVPSPGRPKPPKYDPGDGFFMRHLLAPLTKAILRQHYADLARMEDILRDSDLDWTIVRPPRLTDKPLTGVYRTTYGQNLPGGLSISRADVAHLMLRVLGQPETVKQVIGIAY